MIRKIILFILFLALTAIESGERYFDFFETQFWLVSCILIIPVTVGFFLKKEIGWTFLFFSLLHFFRPLNIRMTEILGADFNGTYYLAPLAFFSLLFFFPTVRSSIDWLSRSVFNRKTILLMLLAVILSSVIMYVYLVSNQDYLDRFLKMLPEGKWYYLIFMGLAYAGLNSLVEEYIFRGMVWNGLLKIIEHPYWIIGVQAAIFGLSHYWGLPGGWSGVGLTFLFALFLGFIRFKTNGVLGCIMVHFGINLTQYFMLFAFK